MAASQVARAFQRFYRCSNTGRHVRLASICSLLRCLDMGDPYRKVDPDESGFWKRDDVAMWGSQGTKFIGCYSGRAGTKEQEAALGLCWRTDAIQEICRARKLGENPHFKTRESPPDVVPRT